MCNLIVFLVVLASSSTLTVVKSDMNTIQTTCKNTKYFDLCISALKSDPRSSTADPKGLAAIIAGNATATANATAAYLSGELYDSSNDSVLKKVLKDCGDKYSLAADSLRLSVQDLDSEDYDYAYMHVMAAEEYPNVCRNIFLRRKGLVYPPEIRRREEGLKRICDVTSGIIINSLGE
ncbi:PREDICTED: cell wall / vacuolar inhibitor of fructosidase 2-like [Tarenaya hassleriana]|uniref:cell wall / vacuolar inhibitor of fructosidase 2-like n=1 Tax=Tarenaya hassleriana TaxID=28532 RepID=UPI00053CA98E|nr:PREDICTED: cell wall / vacuolar inhibitor of fructosidase 2-like [Tarenaya hassleriana]